MSGFATHLSLTQIVFSNLPDLATLVRDERVAITTTAADQEHSHSTALSSSMSSGVEYCIHTDQQEFDVVLHGVAWDVVIRMPFDLATADQLAAYERAYEAFRRAHSGTR